jgi:tetratricopeptide (TPR) repeat protein
MVLVPVMVAVSVAACGCSDTPATEDVDRFQQIEAAFKSATTPDEYLLVAGTYQRLIDADVVSPTILFNQGNAFARAERFGEAIACYRQALRLNPAEPSVRANLRVALQATGAVEPPEDWFKRVLFWQDWIGYAAKFYVATGMLVLAALSVLCVRRWQIPGGTRIAAALLVLAATGLCSATYDWYRFERVSSATLERDVTTRTGNGPNYEPAFNQPLPEGTEVTVLEERGDWLRIVLKGTGNGWIPKDAAIVY